LEKVAEGLYLFSFDGLWYLHQEKAPRFSVVAEKKEELLKFVELAKPSEWTNPNYILELKEKNPEKCRFLNNTATKMIPKKQRIYFIYYEKEIDGKKVEVPAYQVTDGLVIRYNNKHYIVEHRYSHFELVVTKEFKQAKKIAETIKGEEKWDEPYLTFDIKDMREKLKGYRQLLVENPKKFDELMEENEFKKIFDENESIKNNWELFIKNWRTLQKMHGLESVKEQIKRLIWKTKGEIETRKTVQAKKSSMHMVFTGNPGTGKTEIARMITVFLYCLGYIKENKCIETERSEIVSNYIGQTAIQMKGLIKKAKNGTLFIDEAYSLAGGKNDYGKEAIDVLIKSMEDNRENLIVILAGYTNDMEELLEMNKGFRSRIRYYFHFADYTPLENSLIAVSSLMERGYSFEKDAASEITNAVKRKVKNGVVEGNARTIRNMVDDIIEEIQIRVAKEGMREDGKVMVKKIDIQNATGALSIPKEKMGLKEVREQALLKLNEMIGLRDVKMQMKKFMDTLMIQQLKVEQEIPTEKPRLHMVFYGNPGTGKTTVARILGEFFKGSNLLSSGHFTEVSRADLVGEYQGHTAKKVKEVIGRSLGGILFIDEAYSLINGKNDTFGKEAVDTLISEIENNKDNLVVIFAGYKEQMKNLFDANDGFESRISYYFDFEDYNHEEIFQITSSMLDKNKLFCSDETKEVLKNIIFSKEIFNGNGRWANKFVSFLNQEQMARLANKENTPSKEELTTFIKEDVVNAEKMIEKSLQKA
jgi:SpoVK/Ycf46/Vps4 family AAA+-type ATPase